MLLRLKFAFVCAAMGAEDFVHPVSAHVMCSMIAVSCGNHFSLLVSLAIDALFLAAAKVSQFCFICSNCFLLLKVCGVSCIAVNHIGPYRVLMHFVLVGTLPFCFPLVIDLLLTFGPTSTVQQVNCIC